jgi:hypothetical protein
LKIHISEKGYSDNGSGQKFSAEDILTGHMTLSTSVEKTRQYLEKHSNDNNYTGCNYSLVSAYCSTVYGIRLESKNLSLSE